MKLKHLILIILGLFLLTACAKDKKTEEPAESYPVAIETEAPTETLPVLIDTEEPEVGYPIELEIEYPDDAYPISEAFLEFELMDESAQVMHALANKDLESLAGFVHPEMGVRFSPYAYVQEDQLVFFPDELPNLAGSDVVYTWGVYDGRGNPIDLTFDGYFEEFVYSSDFARPEQMAVNERISQGNSIDNIAEFYPGSSFVEYHFSGFDPQYEGMDWQSLRLVFVWEGDAWRLVGIVHDQWTG